MSSQVLSEYSLDNSCCQYNMNHDCQVQDINIDPTPHQLRVSQVSHIMNFLVYSSLFASLWRSSIFLPGTVRDPRSTTTRRQSPSGREVTGTTGVAGGGSVARSHVLSPDPPPRTTSASAPAPSLSGQTTFLVTTSSNI